MQALHSTLDVLRDRWAPLKHTSTFRSTGQITPEEFLHAGDYLVYKFPSWSWAPASHRSKTVSYLPADKQYLVTRGVPCNRRLDANFAGGEERVVKGGEGFDGEKEGEGEGWLSTGGENNGEASKGANVKDVRSLGDKGEVEAVQEEEDEEELEDMEDDDDDEAIIPDRGGEKDTSPLRTYTLYITYTPYYRTPRLFLSGYHRSSGPSSSSVPLPPAQMLEDIVGDYKDKTVTLEDFPFFDTPVKMASVHPCKHASVMKVLLDRADAALKLRREKLKAAARKGESLAAVSQGGGLEGLVEETGKMGLEGKGEEWEVLGNEREDEDEVAIRVDQYVVVFLKFMASVTPGIEHDFTMGV